MFILRNKENPKKHFFFFILFSGIIFFSLISCKKNENKKSEITEIHFVTFKPDQPKVWDESIKLFEKEHPQIKIKREFAPHSTTAFHDLLTQKLKNKSADVDVFFMDVIWPAEFAAAGWAEPLDNYINNKEKDKFIESTIDANTYNGKLYGIPLFTDAGLLYYRKDLLEKYNTQPPQTWEELYMIAQKIVKAEKKQKKNIYGFSGQFKQYEGLVCNMMEFILSNGSKIIDETTLTPKITEEPALNAIRFVRDKIIKELSPPGALAYQEQESLDIFLQGKAIFHRNWPYAWEIVNNPARSRIVGKVGITKIPHFNGNKSYSTLGGWQLGLSAFSKKKSEGWKFVEFMTSEKIQKFLAIKAGIPPTRKSLYNDEDIIKKNPHFEQMREVFFSSYPRPTTPFYPAISNILQRFFSKAISSSNINIRKEAIFTSEEMKKILKRK